MGGHQRRPQRRKNGIEIVAGFACVVRSVGSCGTSPVSFGVGALFRLALKEVRRNAAPLVCFVGGVGRVGGGARGGGGAGGGGALSFGEEMEMHASPLRSSQNGGLPFGFSMDGY